MRPQADPTEHHKPTRYDSADERDQALEGRYDYEMGEASSTVAFVSDHRDELVVDFFAWRRRNPAIDGLWEAVARWEEMRFGARLEPAAHGILAFGIRLKLRPDEGGRRLKRAVQELPTAADTGAVEWRAETLPTPAAVGQLAEDKAMPAAAPSPREYRSRQNQLFRQAQEIQRDAGEEG